MTVTTLDIGGLPVAPGAIASAIQRLEQREVKLVAITPLAADRAENELKHVGYGEPLLVRYLAGGAEQQLVFRTMSPNWFGHDRRSDRATLALLAFDTYGDMPSHVRAVDVGALSRDGELVSLRDAGEPYLLTTYAEGALYSQDLRRIEESHSATPLDIDRARALSNYLARLHEAPVDGHREHYVRAVRDLLGSGEGIFGITDSYPDDGPVPRERLTAIERQCVDWRLRLRSQAHRLRRTHGDFHPYNILFREGVDFTVLDASRGGLGDPADDVAALAINYVFGAVVYPGTWERGLRPLWDTFWSTYLEARGTEVLTVIAPFLAWRALVVASPVWYPDVSMSARDALLGLAENALSARAFDPLAIAKRLL